MPRPRLILASTSPRRRQLLSQAGFHFSVITPRAAETADCALTIREMVSWNALRKGLAVARLHPDNVVLGADTLVALDREAIGKPTSLAEAKRILRRLSGRRHTVASGVFVAHLRAGRVESFCAISHVVFRRLTDEVIESYLAQINPLDKAGAYAAQGCGRVVIRRIVGSRSNVIGLPLEKTRATLARFGIHPQRAPSSAAGA